MICSLALSAFNPLCNHYVKALQRIRNSIDWGEFKEESGKITWTNSDFVKIIEDIESLSFVEKGSHSFKKSYGLKQYLSRIERQSTVVNILLVQVETIGFILIYLY